MRPRKKVLVVGGELRVSELRYVCNVRGFNAIGAESAAEAIQLLGAQVFDAVLLDWPVKGSAELLKKAWRAHVPSMVLATPGTEFPECVADLVLTGRCLASDWVDCLKTAAARKRGPRPGSEKTLEMARRRKQRQITDALARVAPQAVTGEEMLAAARRAS